MKIPSRFFESHRCASKDSNRYQLEGVRFETKKNSKNVRIVATDGVQMLVSDFDSESESEVDAAVTVGNGNCKDAIKLAKKGGVVEMTIEKTNTEDSARYELKPGVNGSTLTGESVGIFPDYKSVIPTSAPVATLRVNPAVLKNALDAVIRAGNIGKNETVKIEFRDDATPIVLKSSNADGKTKALVMPMQEK